MDNYQFLHNKLQAFTRKYYLNQILRGFLIISTAILAYVLLASISEYFAYWPSAVRYSILALFIIGSVASLIYLIIIPMLRMSRIVNSINHAEAARIIGKHFPEVQDKLLNILQLHQAESTDIESRELISASINQKSKSISVLPFTKAINISTNKKYLPYLFTLALLGLMLFLFIPQIFSDASTRLLQPGKNFTPPAPFTFHIDRHNKDAIYQQDYALKAWVKGNQLPANLYVILQGEKLPMRTLTNDTFSYVFRQVGQPIQFQLSGGGFNSKIFTINVAQKPALSAIKVQLFFPAYTGKKAEVRNNLSNLQVPAGTRVQWLLMAKYTDEAAFIVAHDAAKGMIKNGQTFAFQKTFYQDTAASIRLTNKKSGLEERHNFQIQVIADQTPSIQIQEWKDTLTGRYIFLNGTAGDDYGISNIQFHYQIFDESGKSISSRSKALSAGGGPIALFQHQFQINPMNLMPGQRVEYFVEAWDNDPMGRKSVRSPIYSYSMFAFNELDSVMLTTANEMSTGISKSAKQSQQLTEEFKDMQSKMLDGSAMDWETENALQQLQLQQEKLKAQLEKARAQLDEQKKQSELKQVSENISNKQDELKEQMDRLLNKELEEMMKKIKDLLAQKDKQNGLQQLQQLEQQNKLFQMDLERLNSLMKQLEMQMRMEDAAAKAEKLAAEQKNLQQNTDAKTADPQKLKDQQAALKKQLDELMNKELEEIKKLSKETQQQAEVDKMEKEGNEAGKEMEKSSDQLSKQDNKKAAESQSKAAENLQQMANMMQAAAGGMDMDQIEIDIKATRQLLTNLIRLSFDEEKLMKATLSTSTSSKNYLENMQEQKRLHNNSKMIRDSLFALSKRVFKLAPTVNKETAELEQSMLRSTKELEDRRVPEARSHQQYVMTHTNNLALMLNELLANLMQMQADGMKGGAGSCSNPGGKKSGKKPGSGMGMQLSDVITKQKQLGQGMSPGQGSQGNGQNGQQPNGQQPNGSKPGQQGKEGSTSGNGEYGNPEQLVRTAAQQAAIRRQLQEISQMLNSKGMGEIARELREVQQQMDRNETDLVNKRLSGEMMLRQQQILSKLLKAETAIREQEQDDKRSGKAADAIAGQIPADLQKIINERKQVIEVYRSIPAELKPYYKELVNRYFKSMAN